MPYVVVPVGSGTIPVVPGASFQGALVTNGTQVTGAGRIQVSAIASGSLQCARPQAVSLHGTFNAARHLSLSSDPLPDGGALQMEVDIAPDPHVTSKGTTKLTGSCATTGTIQGLLFEPISGSFSGGVSSLDAITRLPVALGTADATFTETDPDVNGQSVVSGSINLKLSACSTQLPIKAVRSGASLSPGGPLSSADSNVEVLLSELPDGTRVNASVLYLGQDCKPVAPPSTVGTSSTIMFSSANSLAITLSKQ
ncbi:hypothetical protein [Terriglobus aquaticus]|uniref:Uncharacterized protein n=1 Tax=Terriglobus aquaticus TaxID=940139 RepID=A0ABW9KP11_9BACT|nr:hypothetical protein [Terriglobus aquaticus]